MRIDCPCCGLRSLGEFAYGGDATRVRPGLDVTDPEPFQAYVYDRANPKGEHREYWQHVGGCRHWMIVTRDTVTHAISGVELAGRHARAGGKA